MKLWEGLGYYSRARNLKRAAIMIQEQYCGMMPKTYKQLLTLPGIGPYTAGAIASIAFKERVPAVDGNVLRVVMRYLNCTDNIALPKTKNKVEYLLQPILPDNVDLFNQALMELGALICVPNGQPDCSNCPLNDKCQSRRHETQSVIPVKEIIKKRRKEEKTILLFLHYDQVAIQKKSNKGLLASLYEFPSIDGHITEEQLRDYLRTKKIDALRILKVGSSKHIFSHIDWYMEGYLMFVPESFGPYEWVSYRVLSDQYALPTAFRYYKQVIEENQK